MVVSVCKSGRIDSEDKRGDTLNGNLSSTNGIAYSSNASSWEFLGAQCSLFTSNEKLCGISCEASELELSCRTALLFVHINKINFVELSS